MPKMANTEPTLKVTKASASVIVLMVELLTDK